MPALPAVDKVLRITYTQSQGANVTIVNRLFVRYGGVTPSTAQLNSYAQTVHGMYHTSLLPQLTDSFYLQETHVVDLSNDTAPEGVYSQALPGSGGGTPAAPGECVCMNWHIDRRYRGGHPRWYQSGINSLNIDPSGSLNATFLSAYATAHNGFLNDVTSTSWTDGGSMDHVAVSYYHGFTAHQKPGGRYENIPTLRPTPLVDPVVGTSPIPKVCSQRRRNQVP
jgi:hypothetical protein